MPETSTIVIIVLVVVVGAVALWWFTRPKTVQVVDENGDVVEVPIETIPQTPPQDPVYVEVPLSSTPSNKYNCLRTTAAMSCVVDNANGKFASKEACDVDCVQKWKRMPDGTCQLSNVGEFPAVSKAACIQAALKMRFVPTMMDNSDGTTKICVTDKLVGNTVCSLFQTSVPYGTSDTASFLNSKNVEVRPLLTAPDSIPRLEVVRYTQPTTANKSGGSAPRTKVQFPFNTITLDGKPSQLALGVYNENGQVVLGLDGTYVAA